MSRWANIDITIYFNKDVLIEELQQLNTDLILRNEESFKYQQYDHLKYTFKNILHGSEGNSICGLFERIEKDNNCWFYIKADLRDIDWYWDKEIRDPFRVFRNDIYTIIKKWILIIDYAKCEINADNDQLVINFTKNHRWIEQTIYEDING